MNSYESGVMKLWIIFIVSFIVVLVVVLPMLDDEREAKFKACEKITSSLSAALECAKK